MSMRFPTKDFKFMDEAKVELITEDDIRNLADEGDTGYIFEVYLSYADEIHDEHIDYPSALGRVLNTEDMLLTFLSGFTTKTFRL